MSAKIRSFSKLPSFGNPPLVEVVAGVQFANIGQFKAPYLGDLWQALGKKEYPKCQEIELLPKITLEPMVAMFGFSPAAELPRIWFVSKDDTSLVQFQRDRFLYNWRKIGVKNNAYPRYKTVIANFFKHYQQLEKCLQNLKIDAPTPEMLELTYVNIIPAQDIKENIFRDMIWQKESRFLPKPNRLNTFWQFPIPETKALLHIHLVTAQNIQDGKPVLKLVMAVRGQVIDKTPDSMKKWFDVSHEWIVRAFDDLTTPKMHKLWKKL